MTTEEALLELYIAALEVEFPLGCRVRSESAFGVDVLEGEVTLWEPGNFFPNERTGQVQHYNDGDFALYVQCDDGYGRWLKTKGVEKLERNADTATNDQPRGRSAAGAETRAGGRRKTSRLPDEPAKGRLPDPYLVARNDQPGPAEHQLRVF